MICLSKLLKFCKFLINFQPEKTFQLQEETEVRILLLRPRLNMKSDLTIWEPCKTLKCVQLRKFKTWRVTLARWEMKSQTNSKRLSNSKINWARRNQHWLSNKKNCLKSRRNWPKHSQLQTTKSMWLKRSTKCTTNSPLTQRQKRSCNRAKTKFITWSISLTPSQRTSTTKTSRTNVWLWVPNSTKYLTSEI